ncbi:Gfo/Idh/MocA family oxidoreductase [Vibrio parahaemolyticus]|uniref:Gfo/Idh/MocA family protein n=1 Tax=Vibrio parahaemolyticus TaxID=670 RepID=UPI0004D8C64B|nr:Gfo/Idh/MocA family oxidoreductase [Vibrio parahaemolyticus]EGQ7875994.1 Gfo/Idh/MocA family oxidoreductase [Vibrio parahaemolyticus]EGQ8011221.1 Gfo/Idh/MocA family oxidoreductase [Vibrio parahaemolyticus]EGR0227006.1 Gfo/Idh/MocA family oxidoreductase [Vibrio parahaemolyticus]EGR1361620.1 gfo/Idh/MocA family oxidoreductase [Vibrio parahaemolyticus]EGR9057826.1 Gfo/Idh/MocA family oxidoreductase [Vibrio parahaemolyticus]
MFKLAVIGTNWISQQFVEAAIQTKQFCLKAVYSRDIEKARLFGTPYDADTYYDSLETLGQDADIDAVYIASPNSLHAPQAIQMLKAGKHVICEKPMASNYALAQQMFTCAEENNVVLFEAFMSPYTPNFQVLKESLPSIAPLRHATISYCQYSSRYQKYLDGENPNTFNPAFSNGSIMDIGYYCVGSAIELFGEPNSVQASAHVLPSGVDGCGSVTLAYDGFNVNLLHSKVSDSLIPSEFQGEQGSVLVDMIATGRGVERILRGEEKETLTLPQTENHMFYEAEAFAKQLKLGVIDEQMKQRSLTVAKVLTEVRKQTGVVFPADQ